ncbi:MAG TPA: DNA-binding transcriptional regulator [Tepidisphaeraceae bacterium]|nr:DNA-binding transcriptional regulator [Tepidisphaeraceae bacterium]
MDGLVVQVTSTERLAQLRAAGVPAVNVSSALATDELPAVVSDDEAVGRLGADHFLRRSFRHFAFYAPGNHRFASLRHEGFQSRLRESACYAPYLTQPAELVRVLAVGDKPLAVMACNDAAGLFVLDRCRDAGLRVPDQVAVLGVDNDDLMQSLAFPPLSSINMATERIGFEAAAMLEKLMAGERPRATRVLVPPTAVVTRPSTDLLAVGDADVADAVRFIRGHVGGAIGVNDVLTVVTLSRRQLERRFRAVLGRSVLDEIRRCRIDRAKQLLIETELTLAQVSTACGFSTPSYFTVVFRDETGQTPGAYRQQHRATHV